MAASGHGVLQAVNDFDMVRPGETFETEFALMEAFFRAGAGRPGSMSLMERDFAPDDWKKIISSTEALNADGLDISFQVAPRAIGAINGLNCTFHPIMAFPSYLSIATLPLAQRVERLRDPEFKAQLLSETPVQLSGDDSPVPPLVDMMIATFPQLSEKIFPMNRHEGSVDYEPSSEASVAGLARDAGVSVWEMAYDLLLEDGGKALFYFPVYNYTNMNYDNVLTMMRHPKALPGLSDGGAHVGTICDASFPTYLLAHWTRDRMKRGKPGIELSRAVQMLTADAADYLGLSDRGRIAVGQKADLNVINYEGLSLGVPVMVEDLPAGGQRLLQPVEGYMATLVNGERVIENDRVTTARPGRLVRSKVERMKTLAKILTGFVALEHIFFLIVEMFLWQHPIGMKMFNLTPEFAADTAVLAQNQGLYNGFLAAGLIWALVAAKRDVRIFFLLCVIVAGVFGAVTVNPTILLAQAVPAALALGLTFLKR